MFQEGMKGHTHTHTHGGVNLFYTDTLIFLCHCLCAFNIPAELNKASLMRAGD